MKKGSEKPEEIIVGSEGWVDRLLDRYMDEFLKNKQYFIAPKKGKKKRFIPKQLHVKKVKHKFVDTNFQQILK